MPTTPIFSAGLKPLTVSKEEFDELTSIIYEKFGICLQDDKTSLLQYRINKLIMRHGYPDFASFIAELKTGNQSHALSILSDHITTNHTYFFREPIQLNYFSKIVLPELQRRYGSGSKDLRIWCAASSSGEEPYTLMILMLNAFGFSYSNWNIGLLATDISQKVLDQANAGIYTDERLAAISPDIKRRYFKQLSNNQWKINEEVKKEVLFRRFNLMNERFPFKSPFHVIFCRNVMIYFDKDRRRKLIGEFIRFLRPGGYLFLGSTENVEHPFPELSFVAPSIYRRIG